jgi:hypothetical protein
MMAVVFVRCSGGRTDSRKAAKSNRLVGYHWWRQSITPRHKTTNNCFDLVSNEVSLTCISAMASVPTIFSAKSTGVSWREWEWCHVSFDCTCRKWAGCQYVENLKNSTLNALHMSLTMYQSGNQKDLYPSYKK